MDSRQEESVSVEITEETSRGAAEFLYEVSRGEEMMTIERGVVGDLLDTLKEIEDKLAIVTSSDMPQLLKFWIDMSASWEKRYFIQKAITDKQDEIIALQDVEIERLKTL
jgi:hypothetical protein